MMNNRKLRFGNQSEATSPGLAILWRGWSPPPKGFDRDEQEGGRGDQGDTEQTPRWAPGRVAQPKGKHRMVSQSTPSRAQLLTMQPTRPAEQENQEEKRSHPEESCRRVEPLPDYSEKQPSRHQHQQDGDPVAPMEGDPRQLTWAGRRFHQTSCQQTTRRTTAQGTERERDGDQGHSHTCQPTHQQGSGLDREPEERSPHCSHPPRPQPKHHQRPVEERAAHSQQAADARQHSPFPEQESANLTTGKAKCPVEPDLPCPLLQPQPKEEGDQQQRRRHQKEAEVAEISTKVGCPSRSGEILCPDRLNGYAKGQGIERTAKVFFELLRRRGGSLTERPPRRNETQRGQTTIAGRPERLAFAERKIGLRRRSVLIPVLLIDLPDSAEIERKGRIPIGEALRPGNSRIFRHEVAVRGQPLERCDPGEPESRRRRTERSIFAPKVVVERDEVPRSRAEILGRPLVEHQRRMGINPIPWKFWSSSPGDGKKCGRYRRTSGGPARDFERGHQGVGDLPLSASNRVCQVGQKRSGLKAKLTGRLPHLRRDRLRENPAGTLHRQRSSRVDPTQTKAEVGQGKSFPNQALPFPRHDPRLDRARSCRQEQSIDQIILIEIALDTPEWQEDGPDHSLAWLEGELPQPLRSENLANRYPHRSARVILAAEERFQRNR